MSIGFIDLGWFEIFLFGLLIALVAAGIAAWYYIEEQKKRSAYTIIAGRDVEKLTTLLIKDLDEIEGWFEKTKKEFTSQSRGESEFLFKKIKTTANKMKKYLGKELSKIK